MAKNSFLIMFALVLILSVYIQTVFSDEDKGVMDKAGDAATKVKDTAQEKAGDTAAKVKDAAEGAKDEGADAAQGAKDKASDAAEGAKETDVSWGDWLKSQLGMGGEADASAAAAPAPAPAPATV